MGLANWGGEHASRNASEPDSVSIGKRRWPIRRLGRSQTRPMVKQQARAAIGPSGMVGDSARGKIRRGAWEILSCGSESNQRGSGRHNRGAARQEVGEAHSVR